MKYTFNNFLFGFFNRSLFGSFTDDRFNFFFRYLVIIFL